MNNQPIGILDSGVGGLSIWKEIIRELPEESTIYIGDTVYAPYGKLSAKKIYSRARKLVKFLTDHDVKAVVIACNTITVYWIDRLREDFPLVPIIGTVPVVKTAAKVTNNKKIGILSTTRTALSQFQEELIRKFADNCTVVIQGTDEIVPLVERGLLEGEEVNKVLEDVLKVFKDENVDTLALGCTHFPFLRHSIRQVLGEKVQVLDSGAAIARQVRRVLTNNRRLANSKNTEFQFFSTGNTGVAKKLLKGTISEVKNISFRSINL